MKVVELSASELTKYAVLMLELAGCRVRKVNNVGVRKKFKNQVEPGWPDIQGYSRTGKVVLCEVKKKGDKLSEAQTNRLQDCEDCGGLVYICYQKITAELVNFKDYLNDYRNKFV